MKANLPENIWNSPAIRKRLWQEAGFDIDRGVFKQQYWMLVPEAPSMRGEITLRNYTPSVIDVDPHELQVHFAKEMREALQRTVAHDGVWIVGYTHPPGSDQVVRVDGDNAWNRIIMIWLDEDADAQFTVESDLPFIDMVTAGKHYYCNLADQAWEKYEEAFGKRAMKGDFMLSEDQKNKEALSTLR